MKKLLLIFLLMTIAGLVALALELSRRPVASTPAAGDSPVSEASTGEVQSWSAEQIASNPTGYLQWSDRQVQRQLEARRQRLEILQSRRGQLVSRQQELLGQMGDVENFHDRLRAAFDRAADEDRWPVRMAGRVFERAKAMEILEQTRVWLDDRRPLAAAYVQSLTKLDSSVEALRGDIRNLTQLRERLALDLERMKLNQGNAELDQLRKTEAQLASMSQSLSQLSDEQAPAMPETSRSSHVDIESILK